ncbi:MAG: glycosyltransferase [Planctomycetota bacterium]
MTQRIALLIHALYGGGAERLMSNLAARWAQSHEIHLVTWAKTETDTYPLPPNVIRHGLDKIAESTTPAHALLANIDRVRSLRKTLRAIEPALILSFSDQMNIVSLEASRPLQIPHWISEHSNPQHQNLGRIWEGWRRRSYPQCHGCTVLDQNIAQWMSRLVPADRLRIIPPSIDINAAENAKNSEAKPSVLFVGRLSQEKRVDLILQAWKGLQTQFPEWELQIVGEGPKREELETQAAALKRVTFHGWCDDPAHFYRQASLFVLASDYEGFPVALLEAMSHGVACVSSRCAGAIDIFSARDGLRPANGNDAKDLAEQMAKLMESSELRQSTGANAKKLSQEYTWDIIGPKWDAILTETLPSALPPASVS